MLKKLAILIAVLFIATSLSAQEATLNTPVTFTARTPKAKIVVDSLTITATTARIDVIVKDSANADIERIQYNIPDVAFPSATVPGVFTALDTIRAGETGTVLRRANFRLLGFLQDNGFFATTPVTLVP